MSEADEWKKWDGWVPGDPVPGDLPGTRRPPPGSRRPDPPPPPPVVGADHSTHRRRPSPSPRRRRAGRTIALVAGFAFAVGIIGPVLAIAGLVRFTTEVEYPPVVPATVPVDAWPQPEAVIRDLSVAAGRPVTHVVRLHLESGVVSADVVWPDQLEEVERWTLGPSGSNGPFDAPPLDDRPVVALADLAASPWSAMLERAVGTLAAGGGVERIVVRAGLDGSPEVEVHVAHASGSAGHVVFDATGEVRTVDAR